MRRGSIGSWSSLIVTSLLYESVVCSIHRRSPVADPCLSQCKDTHVYDMHSILGSDATESSSEFIRPLHTILFTSTSEREVFSRLDAVCKYNRAHHQCLAACPDNSGTRALIIGLRPWSFICKSWKYGELKGNIPCLSKHIAALDRTCAVQLENLKRTFNSIWESTGNVQNQLGPMCRASKSYDLCYGDAVGYYCGQRAVSFWQSLSDVSNATVIELLSISDSLIIPDQCKRSSHDASMPPIGGGEGKASAHRQVSTRSRGADLTVEKFWGKGGATGKGFFWLVYLLSLLLVIDY